MEKQKVHKFTTAFIFIMMLLAAVAENTRGVFVPTFKSDFGFSDTQIGNMFLLCSLGYTIATFFGGALCEKLGQKKVFTIGILTMIISLAMLSRSYNPIFFLVSMTLSSCGLALSAIAINTVIPIIFIAMQSIIMNLVHFSYGLGSAVGQKVSGTLIYNGVNWRTIYLGVAIIYIVMLLLFNFVKIPDKKISHEEKKTMSLSEALSNKVVIFYIAALGFYMFAECGTGNWFVNYMEKSFDFNKSQSTTYLSIFFTIFAIGRLFGGFVVEKRGYLNVVLKSLIVGLIIYTIGFALGENGVLIIGASGLFFAVSFPTIVLSVSKVFKNGSSYITGIVVTFASFINMIMNSLMGFLNDGVGARFGLILVPISLILSILSLFIVYNNTKKDLVESR